MGSPLPLLDAKGIVRSYGARVVLPGVDVCVAPGEALAIVGPSGAGKSTLLQILAGLDYLDAGTIRYGLTEPAIEFTALSERAQTLFRRQHFGFVFQFFNLVPTLTVAGNVLLPRRLAGKVGDDAPALHRLHELGIVGRDAAYPHELSGGEQQRVAIARALAHEPRLVFADEPTGNLDVRAADDVFDLLLEHTHGAGAALIIATHSERLAQRAMRVLDLAAIALARPETHPANGAPDAPIGETKASIAIPSV